MRPICPDEEVFCRNCGRYIGSLGRCPYCRTKSPKRRSYKLLKWGGLALAVLGTLAIYAYALGFQGPPPQLEIEDIEPTMNFGTVQLNGVVTGVRYEADTEWLAIFLDDNTGSIFIRVYDSETEALIKRNNVPGVGQRINITGRLRNRPDFNMMILQVANGLKIKETPPLKENISAITSSPENYIYERVQLEGKIISKEKDAPYEGTASIEIQDPTTGESLEAFISYKAPWFEEWFNDSWDQISVGDTLRITGGIDLYYESVQLYPANPSDLEVIS